MVPVEGVRDLNCRPYRRGKSNQVMLIWIDTEKALMNAYSSLAEVHASAH